MSKKKFTEAAASSFQEALQPEKSKMSMTSTKIDRQIYAKLKAISFWERVNLQEATSSILKYYVDKYEKQHGPIKPIPQESDRSELEA